MCSIICWWRTIHCPYLFLTYSYLLWNKIVDCHMCFKYIIISKELSNYSEWLSCSLMYTNKNFLFHGIIRTSTRQTKLRTEAMVVVMVLWLDKQLPMQSVPITTNVVSSNPTQEGVYLIHHYVINLSVTCIKSVGFHRLSPPIKRIATLWLKYCQKWR